MGLQVSLRLAKQRPDYVVYALLGDKTAEAPAAAFSAGIDTLCELVTGWLRVSFFATATRGADDSESGGKAVTAALEAVLAELQTKSVLRAGGRGGRFVVTAAGVVTAYCV